MCIRDSSTPTRRAVDLNGNPIAPSGPPSGSGVGYDNSLKYVSVFGPMQSNPSANDCSNAPINKTTLVPNGVSVTGAPGTGGGWDPFRHQMDTSGYTARVLALTP